MPETDWRAVVARLRQDCSGSTPAQIKLAQDINLSLPLDTPRLVAAALLRRRLDEPLGLPPPSEVTEPTLEYLHDLAEQTSSPEPTVVTDRALADAWIRVMYAKRAVAALEKLRPEPGDVVEIATAGDLELREVASIGADGQLFFRGGLGQRARPHLVRMVARTSAANHEEAAFKARQQTAARAGSPERVGPTMVAELASWQVSDAPGPGDVLALKDALDSATDERPLQKVLEEHPEILAYLVTGHHGAYVIPQQMLGKEYVPDFLIAAYTSAGLWWTLVELESPTAPLTIKDGQPSKQLRKAIQQINDWREWLVNNLDYARRSKRESGLGLPGIRHDARALIIISRETMARTPDVMRFRQSSTVPPGG